jgi:hypothetical protein
MATKGKKRKRREADSEEPVERASEPPASAPPPGTAAKMRTPLIPLLWLLVPFLAVFIYGLLTR